MHGLNGAKAHAGGLCLAVFTSQKGGEPYPGRPPLSIPKTHAQARKSLRLALVPAAGLNKFLELTNNTLHVVR